MIKITNETIIIWPQNRTDGEQKYFTVSRHCIDQETPADQHLSTPI